MWFNHVPFSPYHGSSNLEGGWFNGGFVKLLVNLMGGGEGGGVV